MSHDGKNKFPEKDTPGFFALCNNIRIGMTEGGWKSLRWIAAKTLSVTEKLEDGPLAFVTLPLTLPLREGAKSILKNAPRAYDDASFAHHMGNVVGAMAGVPAAVGLLMATTTNPGGMILGGICLGASAVAGVIIGPAIVSAAVPLAMGTFRALSSIPRALSNIPTGFRRSLYALSAKPEPKVINPVPDRGIETPALPGPSALLKLTDVAQNFNQPEKKPAAVYKIKLPKPPSIS